MKGHVIPLFITLALLAHKPTIAQQTTAFTWQGRITDNGVPAIGHYDLQFRLFADAAGTTQIGSSVCIDDVTVANGLASAELDFGSTAFTGHARWLEIGVRPDTGLDCSVTTGFTNLIPLRRMNPSPYALNTDRLDNYDSSSFLLKPIYDSNGDLKIDAAALELPMISSLSASDGSPAVALMADDTGSIGIGTSEPRVALHVDGQVRTSAPGVQFGDTPMGGIGMDQHGGNLALYQSDGILVGQHTSNNPLYGLLSTADRWQSFTANIGLEVNAVDVMMSNAWGASAEGTLVIYDGIGIDGEVLAVSTRTLANANATYDWQRVPIDPPLTLVPSAVYTIQLVGDGFGLTSWLVTLGDEYAGGIADSDPAHDHVFKLISFGNSNAVVSVTPFGYMGVGTTHPASKLAIDGSASIGSDYCADEIAPTDGLLVQGQVGVGTATPMGALDVAGAMNVGVNYAGVLTPPANGLLVENRIGIGTTSPVNKLDVEGGVAIGSGFAGSNVAPPDGLIVQGISCVGTTNQLGRLTVDATTSHGALFLDGNASNGTWLEIRNNNAGGTKWAVISTGTSSPNGSGDLSINSGNTPQLILTDGGRNGFGRYPTANRLEVEGNASKTAAGGFIANSDARIKTDVATVTNAMDTLMKVRPVTFHYTPEYRKEHPSIEDRPYHNVIAQEYAGVFPDYVQKSGEKVPGTDDEILQADTHALTIVSVAAIQEMQKEIERLRAENREVTTRLENKILGQQELLYELEKRMNEFDLQVAEQAVSSAGN